MARNEADREDLLAEAVALVRRVELRASPWLEPIIAGFRATGHFSLYFGQDLVYQFDPAGRLRRAHERGRIYRTQGTTLAELERVRSATETTLVRRDLEPNELAAFRERMRGELCGLIAEFGAKRVLILRQFPEADSLISQDLLTSLKLSVARPDWLAPSIPGKR